MDIEILKQTVIDQFEHFKTKVNIMPRWIPEEFWVTKKIVVISGIRRAGKSTLLWLMGEKIKPYYYLNFEDERLLKFTAEDFNPLLEIFHELYGERNYFLFDEIQNIACWEKFVRRLFDEGYKIFITGSNSKLLSSELSASLTGRHLKYELYPFSFKEYLTFSGFETKEHYTTKEKANIKSHLTKYLIVGGFPEIIKTGSKTELSQLYQDIIIKDLLVRFGIKEIQAFRELAMYLISNITSYISYNNLAKILKINSVTTVKNFISFFEEAYLIFSLQLFDYSYKKQIVNNKKIYVIDTGIYHSVSFRFSKNIGNLYENIVYIELRRRSKEVYYYKDAFECDFLIRKGIELKEAIQVCFDISETKTLDREIRGLSQACNIYNLKKGIIITYDVEKSLTHNGVKINFVPLWKWLLP